ncbi:MAG: 50S ribosomal protein L15 [Patescibacteria group bacterium]|nr:50S ribosomal protein L15 [Patescibacteria group bacterium]
MEITLDNLKNPNKKKKRRKGRGDSSGRGTYSGRGQKGQKSRSGGQKGLRWLGLRQTLKRIPKKRGFKSFYPKMSVINIGDLDKHFDDGEIINQKKLLKMDLVNYSPRGLKVLGQGKINKKLIVKAKAFSKSAKEAIVKAGGQAEEIK